MCFSKSVLTQLLLYLRLWWAFRIFTGLYLVWKIANINSMNPSAFSTGGFDRFFSQYPDFCLKTKSLPSSTPLSVLDSSCRSTSCGTPQHDQVTGDYLFRWVWGQLEARHCVMSKGPLTSCQAQFSGLIKALCPQPRGCDVTDTLTAVLHNRSFPVATTMKKQWHNRVQNQ